MLAVVNSNGNVMWMPPGIIESSCEVNVALYPFDTQTCPLTFGTWSFTDSLVNVRLARGGANEDSIYKTNNEWSLDELSCIQITKNYGVDQIYTSINCHLNMTRRPLFYIFNLVLPCFLLLLVGSLTFCIPPDSGEKVSLAVTVLLALIVFMMAVMEKLPASSLAIPLLGKLITVYYNLLYVNYSR